MITKFQTLKIILKNDYVIKIYKALLIIIGAIFIPYYTFALLMNFSFMYIIFNENWEHQPIILPWMVGAIIIFWCFLFLLELYN